MKTLLLSLTAAALPAVALAQGAAITASPLMPLTGQYQSPQPPQDTPVQAGPSAPQPAPQVPVTWVAQPNAVLQFLDKVNAQTSLVTVKVGQSAQFGTLTIQVQACDNRGPDQPQDSTALLNVTDSHPDSPGFRGWMLAGNPSLSMLQHPIYDVRVVGCRA